MNETLPTVTVLRPRIFYLDAARFAAIFLIVLNHAFNRAYSYTPPALLTPFLAGAEAVIQILSRLGVPLFLMITGALLLNKPMKSTEDVQRFYRHNLLRLLLTSEIWYLLMFLLIQALNPDAVPLHGWAYFSNLLGTMLFINQTTMGSMWYIPMILFVYLLIPYLNLAVHRFSPKVWLLPGLVIFCCGMLLPNINTYFEMIGSSRHLQFAWGTHGTYFYYFLFVLLGYLIGQGALSRIPTWVIRCAALVLFALCCAYQAFAYSCAGRITINYDFCGILFTAVPLFEWIRRSGSRAKNDHPVVAYIAKISFGIYFVHICIMSLMYWYMDFSTWPVLLTLLFLEAASILGSIAIIAPLSRVPLLKKYLFMIKD